MSITRNIREFSDGDFKTLRSGSFVDQEIVRALADAPHRVFEDEDELVQRSHAFPQDRIGDMKLYETFYRHYITMPYMYMGLCEKGDKVNRSPAKGTRTFIISQFHAEDEGQRAFNMYFAKALAWLTYCSGEFPIVPHLYFPQFITDEGYEREWGIQAGHCLMAACDRVTAAVVCGNISKGMKSDIDFASLELGMFVETKYYSADEAIALIEKFKESRA